MYVHVEQITKDLSQEGAALVMDLNEEHVVAEVAKSLEAHCGGRIWDELRCRHASREGGGSCSRVRAGGRHWRRCSRLSLYADSAERVLRRRESRLRASRLRVAARLVLEECSAVQHSSQRLSACVQCVLRAIRTRIYGCM